MVDDQTVVLDAPATNGNILVLVAHIAGRTQTFSITDNGGTMTWNQVVLVTHPTANARIGVYWGIVSGAPQTITIGSSGSAATNGHLVEVNGLMASPYDVSATGDATGATSHNVSAALTPSQANVLLVGGVLSSTSATYSVTPTSFTAIGVGATARGWGGYRIVSSITTYDFASTSSATEDTVTALAAFKMAATGGAFPHHYYQQMRR